jgi:hypothetical protein
VTSTLLITREKQLYVFTSAGSVKVSEVFRIAKSSFKTKCVHSKLGYELDDRGSRVRFPAGAGNFSLYHRVQNGSWAHLAYSPVDIGGFYHGGKTAGPSSRRIVYHAVS